MMLRCDEEGKKSRHTKWMGLKRRARQTQWNGAKCKNFLGAGPTIRHTAGREGGPNLGRQEMKMMGDNFTWPSTHITLATARHNLRLHLHLTLRLRLQRSDTVRPRVGCRT
eukprot:EG_transcript_18397